MMRKQPMTARSPKAPAKAAKPAKACWCLVTVNGEPMSVFATRREAKARAMSPDNRWWRGASRIVRYAPVLPAPRAKGGKR